MADNLKKYPRGQIGHGAGQLISVENVTLDMNFNTKLKHTLARTPSGYVSGSQESTLSFKINISEDGPERDFYAMLKSQTVQGFRLLCPGGLTFRVSGVVSKNKYDLPLDDAVTADIELVCKVEQA